ncbi:MAG: hypothetical protein ABIQ16_27535 [Polyangiaceae bacterium]
MIRAPYGRNVLVGLGLLLAGCVESPGAEPIIGPDGTRLLHVHCADEQVACFRLAGERCPHGYDLSPIFDPHDGNFLVRCREPPTTTVIVANPPPNRGATTGSAAANDRWPPAEVATPSDPWPAAPSNALPPTQHSADGAVDLGY